MNQRTIARSVACSGIGLHSGDLVEMQIVPAKRDTGIVFIRKDVSDIDNVIPAVYDNVSDCSFCTTLSNSSNVKISTIEHLMAALYSCGVDNAIININGNEVPIMDGSSSDFIALVDSVGTIDVGHSKRALKVLKEIYVSNKDSKIVVAPSYETEINIQIDFASIAIGTQQFSFNPKTKSFKEEISSARTFGFIKDLERLKSLGLALGASSENAIGIDENDRIMTELRYNDEFVRHKMLDFIGDIYTSGFSNIIGNIRCDKPGHYINNLLLREIFSDPNNYTIV